MKNLPQCTVYLFSIVILLSSPSRAQYMSEFDLKRAYEEATSLHTIIKSHKQNIIDYIYSDKDASKRKLLTTMGDAPAGHELEGQEVLIPEPSLMVYFNNLDHAAYGLQIFTSWYEENLRSPGALPEGIPSLAALLENIINSKSIASPTEGDPASSLSNLMYSVGFEGEKVLRPSLKVAQYGLVDAFVREAKGHSSKCPEFEAYASLSKEFSGIDSKFSHFVQFVTVKIRTA